jgi:hypothetical protein
MLVLAILIAATLAAPGASTAQTAQEGLEFFDTGPLRIREQFLLGQGFLAFEPTSADLLERGHWQVDLIQNVTNNWAKSDVVTDFLEARSSRSPVTLEELRALDSGEGRGLYFTDGELHRASLSVRYGLGRGLHLSVTVPVLSFRGGIGDSVVEEFHDAFGFGQSGRKGVPKGAFTTYLRDREGREVFRQREPSTGIGDLSLGLKARLPASEAWDLAVEGQIKLPTGDADDLYGSGSIDVGAQLLATRYFARSCIHAGLSVIYLGEAAVLGTGEQTVAAVMIGYEHGWGRNASVILQATASQSPFRQLGIQKLDDIAYLVDLGVKKGIGERWVAFVALSENLLTFGSTADVGLHWGLTWTR